MPSRQIDQVEIIEQCAGTQHHQRSPGRQRRLGDVAQDRGGGAFDDDFGLLRQLRQPDHRYRMREIGHRRCRPRRVARRHRGQDQPLDPAVEPFRDRFPDRPKPA